MPNALRATKAARPASLRVVQLRNAVLPDGAAAAAERREFTRRLKAEPHAAHVGAFEGAMYEAQGLFRPAADCLRC